MSAQEQRPTSEALNENPAGASRNMITVPTATARIHEPSAWLRGAAATRVRQIEAELKDTDTSAYGAIVAPLGRTGVPGSREDRSCDRCRIFVPEGDLLYMFVHRPTPRIHLTGGLCGDCARKEGAR